MGDPGYLEGLRALLTSLDEEASLTPIGAFAIRAQIVEALRSRILLERGWREHPAAARATVERPLIITGLARTGTSALHQLLAADPALQGLELWLAGAPKPRPPREQWSTDADFVACDERMRALHERSPNMQAIHRSAADQVDECWYLLAQDFAHSGWEALANVPSFAAWWAASDMRGPYRRHRRNLQLIGHREPERRWLLKDSTHLFDLDALLSVYPDAMVVHTHRDPVPVIASTCSLCWSARSALDAAPDAEAFGRSTLALWERAITRTLAVRAARDPSQFYDLHFDDFQRDPIAAVASIYDHFGLRLSAEAEAAMRRQRSENPRGKYGEHRYTLGDWQLSADEIRERFRPYVERFGIACRPSDD